MDGQLCLNEIHSELISNYLKFCKYQRGQRIKSVDYCFTSLLNCRVRSTETYTGDEVKTLLQDLQDIVRGEIDTELTDAIHTNILLIQELLKQAEEWHLTLTADISEMENREKLNNVRLFDEQQGSDNSRMTITVTQAKQVIPVEDMNVATALKHQIEKLSAENELLETKIKLLEPQALELSQNENQDRRKSEDELLSLRSQLEKAETEVIRLKAQVLANAGGNEDTAEKLILVQEAVDTLSKELEISKTRAQDQNEKLREQLEERENKLRQVQSNLMLAEKELDKKFQATTAYLNMKKILTQKNSQIKTLRKRLEDAGIAEQEPESGKIATVEVHHQYHDQEEEEGFHI